MLKDHRCGGDTPRRHRCKLRPAGVHAPRLCQPFRRLLLVAQRGQRAAAADPRVDDLRNAAAAFQSAAFSA